MTGHELFQPVQLPMCKSASFPGDMGPCFLGAFEIPQIHSLDLSNRPAHRPRGLHLTSIPRFSPHTRTMDSCRFSQTGLQDALEMRPELEILKIRGLLFPRHYGNQQMAVAFLDSLGRPHRLNGMHKFVHDDHAIEPPRQDLPLCPKLKVLVLELISKGVRRRALLRWDKMVRKCQKLMRQRMETGCPLERCQLICGASQIEMTNELIEQPYLDIPDAELPSLGDISTC